MPSLPLVEEEKCDKEEEEEEEEDKQEQRRLQWYNGGSSGENIGMDDTNTILKASENILAATVLREKGMTTLYCVIYSSEAAEHTVHPMTKLRETLINDTNITCCSLSPFLHTTLYMEPGVIRL